MIGRLAHIHETAQTVSICIWVALTSEPRARILLSNWYGGKAEKHKSDPLTKCAFSQPLELRWAHSLRYGMIPAPLLTLAWACVHDIAGKYC